MRGQIKYSNLFPLISGSKGKWSIKFSASQLQPRLQPDSNFQKMKTISVHSLSVRNKIWEPCEMKACSLNKFQEFDLISGVYLYIAYRYLHVIYIDKGRLIFLHGLFKVYHAGDCFQGIVYPQIHGWEWLIVPTEHLKAACTSKEPIQKYNYIGNSKKFVSLWKWICAIRISLLAIFHIFMH